MDVSAILDVVIGVVFVFLVFSLIVSGIGEAISKALAWRSRHLWRALTRLIDGKSPSALRDQRPMKDLRSTAPTPATSASTIASEARLTESLYAHPLIRQLEGRNVTERSRLAAIPKADFARALIDIVAPNDADPSTVDRVRQEVKSWGEDIPMRAPLLALAAEAEGQISRLQDGLGEWFDARMDLLTAAYRRHVKWLLLGVAIIVTLVFNVDSIRAARTFYEDEALRTAVAERAIGLTTRCENMSESELSTCIREGAEKANASLTLPVGWSEGGGVDGWHVLGWLIAVIALSQGGPFWFDVLRKVSGLKGSKSSTSQG
jgi:hypothetical protein